jgi:uncharacterized protein YqeY
MFERLQNDLKVAMKAGDAGTVGTLRYLIAQVKNFEIEKRAKESGFVASDEDVMSVLKKEVKKRQDSIALFREGNRADLAEHEEKEIVIIQAYLPESMSREAIEEIVKKVIADGAGDFGAVMREVTKSTKGNADGRLVSEIVKEHLASHGA